MTDLVTVGRRVFRLGAIDYGPGVIARILLLTQPEIPADPDERRFAFRALGFARSRHGSLAAARTAGAAASAASTGGAA